MQNPAMVRVASWRVVGAYGSGETCAVVSLHGTQIGFRPGLVGRKPNRFSWNCVAWLCGPGPASASLEREGTRTALGASRACLDPDPAHSHPALSHLSSWAGLGGQGGPFAHPLTYPTRGTSTMRAQFQRAATNVLQLVELSRWSHVDFRSSFGTVFPGVRRVFTLSGDR
jgi:hypothetical protein